MSSNLKKILICWLLPDQMPQSRGFCEISVSPLNCLSQATSNHPDLIVIFFNSRDIQGHKEVIELCRALIKGEQWSRVASLLKAIKTEPETVRYAVLGYARACLLGGKNARAALVIDAFADNFYDSKEAGLALACYEIIEGI